MFERVNAQISVDSSLSFEGESQSNGSGGMSLSELKVKWKGEHFDSLHIEHNIGDASSCGGFDVNDRYSLKK
jgi:hypothetical protein